MNSTGKYLHPASAQVEKNGVEKNGKELKLTLP
jgi:hypothetical protein